MKYEIEQRLDLEVVTDVVGNGRLRWFWHLERKIESDSVSACRNIGCGWSGE